MFGGISGETPPYDIIAKKDGYEIRRYQKQFLAQDTYEVPLGTDFLSKAGTGFYPLFKYISGNNQTQTKMAMTVPVIMKETQTDTGVKRTMSFIMSPSKFTSLDQLPTANDKDVRIIEQASLRDMACITFNMSMTTERNAAKEQQLREAARRDGISLSSDKNDVLYFGYNSPFTIPYFRRNEICIPIISEQST